MAILRNVILWLGLLVVAGGAVAETIAKSGQPPITAWIAANKAYTSAQGLCDDYGTGGYGASYAPWTPDISTPLGNGQGYMVCRSGGPSAPYAGWGFSVNGGLTCGAGAGEAQVAPVNGLCAASCPSTGGWTDAGAHCTRPDCRADQTRDNAGVCMCPVGKTDNGTVCVTSCPTGYHNLVPDNGQCEADCIGRQTQAADGTCKCSVSGGMISTDYAAFKDDCIGGCAVSWGAGVASPVGVAGFIAGTRTAAQVAMAAYIRFNGATCTAPSVRIPANITFLPKDTTGTAADGTTPDPLNKPETNQSPEACAAAGGSYGVFNGVSKCLTDSGNSMQRLAADRKSTTTFNPDGTSTVTTHKVYTIKDPNTGEVITKRESTTEYKNSSGVTTGTGSGSAVGTGADPKEAGDLCKNNPGLDICNNKLNKEATQQSVLDALKSLTDPGNTSYQALETAKQSTQADADLKAETDKFTAIMDQSVDPASGPKSAWAAAMTSGWFDAIPASACAPYTATIGGRTWTIDICPIAAKVATIAEYCMWFGVVVGCFVMLTGGSVGRVS